MSSAPDQQQTVSKIIRFVEERLGEEGKQVINIKNEIEKALQIASEFGLISAQNNIVRLRYNPNSKPPFGFLGIGAQRESRRSVHINEGRNEVMDTEGDQNGTTADDTKATCDKAKSSKNTAKKTSDYSIFSPVPSEIKRRKKSRGRSKRKRSKSRRRRKRR